MNKELKQLVNQFETEFDQKKYKDAEKTINSAIKESPNEKKLYAYQALLLSMIQKEMQAVDALKKSELTTQNKTYKKAAQNLTNYFYCRKQTADKVNGYDEKGEKKSKELSKISKLKPEDVGISISACLITKNEENNLERCLKSLQNIVDEIIVVDTGSTDKTIEIAQKYNATIGHYKWNDDFSAARNESLKLATSKWILWIDADEELDPSSVKMLREGLMRPQFGGFFIKISNYLSDLSESEIYVHSPIRIFRNIEGIQFEGRVHEQMVNSIKKIGLPTATLNGVQIFHHGYKPDQLEAKQKTERMIKLLKKEVKDNPKNDFQWFNLANTYAVMHDFQQCAKAARKAADLLPQDAPYASQTYQLLGNGYIYSGKPKKAIEACKEAKKRGFWSIINSFVLSDALFRSEKYEDALTQINETMDMEWEENLTGDYGIVTHKSHILKAQILSHLERYQEAFELINYAEKINPNLASMLFCKGCILAITGNSNEALPYLERCYQSNDHALRALELAINIYYEQKAFQKVAESAANLALYGKLNTSQFGMWAQACENINDPLLFNKAMQTYKCLEEKDGNTLINWGRALTKNGYIEDARQIFKESTEIDPENPNTFLNYGDLLYKNQNYLEAANQYEKGIQLNPVNPEAWFTLGNCLYHLNAYEPAQKSYEQALRLNPTHHGAQNNLELLKDELTGTAN